MNREEQIKMWEAAAGKMGEKFGTGGPKKPVPGAAAKQGSAAVRGSAAVHGSDEGVRGSAAVHGSSAEAAAKRKNLFGK